MEGWIKLHRKIIESAVFDNPGILKTWLWCLCKAAYTERETIVGRQPVVLKPGQFIFGRKSAGNELNINERTVYDYMKVLESIGCVSLKPNNKFTVVTIENWGIYQDVMEEPQQQSDNNTTTKLPKNSTKPKAEGHKQEIKENNKGNKEKNNVIYPPKGGLSDKTSDIPSFPLEDALLSVKEVSKERNFSPELQEAFTRWVKHKYSIGGGFKNAHAVDKVGASIENESLTYTNGVNGVIRMIDYCIATRSKSLCWSRIFEFLH